MIYIREGDREKEGKQGGKKDVMRENVWEKKGDDDLHKRGG